MKTAPVHTKILSSWGRRQQPEDEEESIRES